MGLLITSYTFWLPRLGPQFKIFWTVIISDAVDMMDMFAGFKASVKNLFHDQPMFLHIGVSTYPNLDIALLSEVATTPPRWVGLTAIVRWTQFTIQIAIRRGTAFRTKPSCTKLLHGYAMKWLLTLKTTTIGKVQFVTSFLFHSVIIPRNNNNT